MNAASASSELEIEKKFAITDAKKLEATLSSLGFEVTRREEFADWYFDLPAPHWHFSLNDCWFRYREKKIKIVNNYGWKGTWQVKRGQKDKDEEQRDNDGMTVYEELQGKDAKKLILDMLADLSNGVTITKSEDADTQQQTSPLDFGHDVPYLAGAERLVPFARLETFRTCYENKQGGEFANLKVDVDKTDFGYMVGEVEAVLDGENTAQEVDAAKDSIRKLVDLISSESQKDSDDDTNMIARGKLEYYLINNHRYHYDACVKAGVILN